MHRPQWPRQGAEPATCQRRARVSWMISLNGPTDRRFPGRSGVDCGPVRRPPSWSAPDPAEQSLGTRHQSSPARLRQQPAAGSQEDAITRLPGGLAHLALQDTELMAHRMCQRMAGHLEPFGASDAGPVLRHDRPLAFTSTSDGQHDARLELLNGTPSYLTAIRSPASRSSGFAAWRLSA